MPKTLNRVDMPQLFTQAKDTISFSGGLPDLSVLPADQIATVAQRLLKIGSRIVLQYSTPHVAPRLVPAIADLAQRESMTVTAENLVPTAGSQLGLVVTAATLTGDVILADSPSYPGALAAFSSAGLQVAGVVCDGDGMVPEAMDQAIALHQQRGARIAAVYTTPTFHNPTGATQPMERRERIVELCRSHDIVIIEDNPYGLLSFRGEQWPALKSLAPEQVIYLGTFSKTFAPGVRCGWIDAPAHRVDELRAVSETYTLSPSALNQAIIADYHRTNGWDELLQAYRGSYHDRAALMSSTLCVALDEAGAGGLWQWQEPEGGFYLWLTHWGGADAAQVARQAARAGVSVVPGTHFGADGQHRSSMRLCFSYPSRDDIVAGARRLAGALAQTAEVEA